MSPRPLLVAHYMPWFEANPKARSWGWHWTMNAFVPERVANGKREIASRYYPEIGPYDSGDATVVEYHLLLMKLAGIDGVIVDWYGLSDLFDYPILHRNTGLIFEHAKKIGLKVAICYEDQTIPRLVESKKLAETERVAHARRELNWLRKNWFAHSAYLKLGDKPVLLSFGAGGLTDDEWARAILPSDGPLLYFSEHRRRPCAAGAFDWPQPALGVAGQEKFLRENGAGSLRIPGAFPRFDDAYREGKAGDGFPKIPDDDGKTFARTLERAHRSGAPLVQLATWNDWGEGTQIEPSAELGYRDLETIQKIRRVRATPGDLRLPGRLLAVRRGPAPNSAALDGVARQLAAGKLAEARKLLDRL